MNTWGSRFAYGVALATPMAACGALEEGTSERRTQVKSATAALEEGDLHVAPEVTLTPQEVTPALLATEDIVGFMQANTDGTVGVYAKAVGGPVLSAFNETTIFEPASSIKVLVHVHAMRQVQLDPAVTLADPTDWLADINKFEDGAYECGDSDCYADNTELQTDPLEDLLRLMMECSDNATTQATRDLFGDANIMDTAYNVVGVSADTQLDHSIGCGSDAVASPNQFTLVDAGIVYEQSATGLFDTPTTDSFRELMANGTSMFTSVVDAEQGAVGLTNDEAAAVKAGIETAWKGGSYGLDGAQYRSLAGWMSVHNACEDEDREYVFGNFVDSASDLDLQDTGEDLSVFQVGGMLMSDPIVEAMESKACDRPPTLSVVPNFLILECSEPGGVPSDDPAVTAFLASPSASDECGEPTVTHTPLPALLPSGCPNEGTSVTFTATDSCGNDASQLTTIYVEDTTAPTVACSVDVTELFAGDHGFVDVGFDFSGTDVCDPDGLAYSIEVFSDEPTANSKGAGGTLHAPDAIVGANGSVQLRAERSAQGDGRVYRIVVTATDPCGNASTCEAEVGVPKNPAMGPAVDSGTVHDATEVN